MNKGLFAILLMCTSYSHAQYLMPKGFDFVAPVVSDYQNAPNQTGLIVYDQSIDKYMARHGSAWKELTNSVSAASSATVVIASAKVTYSGGTPSVTSDGNWVSSVTDNGTGDVTLNFSGIFSSAPNCTCTPQTTSAVNDIDKTCAINGPTSTTTVRTFTEDSSTNNAHDMNYMIICIGAI